MEKLVQYAPHHPGEILNELYFQPLNLTVTEAAGKLLITRPNLSGIVNGKNGISPQMALKLAKAFNTTPQYWMNLQNNYDLWKASQQKGLLRKVRSLV